jgi:hypothetical protein
MHVFAGAVSADRMDPDASPIAPWISSVYEATTRSPKILHLQPFHNFCGQLVDCPVYAAFLEQHQSLSRRCSKFRREFLHAVKGLPPILELSDPSFLEIIPHLFHGASSKSNIRSTMGCAGSAPEEFYPVHLSSVRVLAGMHSKNN